MGNGINRALAGIMAAALAAFVVCTARAENTVSELGYSMQGFAAYFEQAAVVGKIIACDEDSGEYIVYGRLSTCEGYNGIWRVFQTGRFYEVIPLNQQIKSLLPGYIGQGVKLFGSMETGKEGRCVLLARDLVSYEPGTDIQAGVLPAWTEGREPDQDWTGFGIQTGIYTGCLIDFNLTTELVECLVPVKQALEGEGLRLVADSVNPEAVVIKDAENGSQWDEQDVARLWAQYPQGETGAEPVPNSSGHNLKRRRWLSALRSAYPFNRVDYLISDDSGINESARAVGGYCWLYVMKGANNSYLLAIPIIRRDLDAFMSLMEDAGQGSIDEEFSEWAVPALFYGQVTPQYETLTDAGGISSTVYNCAVFKGYYYASDEPRLFIEKIQAAAGGLDSEPGQELPGSCETWRLEGIDEQEALNLNAQKYVWLSGFRCLDYIYSPPDGSASRLVTITRGSHRDESDYALVDHYIMMKRQDCQGRSLPSALGRPEFDFILNCLRDITDLGGI